MERGHILQDVIRIRYTSIMILWEDVKKCKALIQQVQSNACTSFYKDRFVGVCEKNIQSIVDVPLLERKDLTETHPSNRCFVSDAEIDFIAYTSGTTGGEPLLTYVAEVENYFIDPAWGLEVSKLLVVYPPLNKNFGGTFIQQCRQSPSPVVPIFGDVTNMATSAYLADSVSCDAVYATPSLALSLAPYLKKYYSIEAITFLAISGETIGETKLATLQALYPKAYIANLYASSEIGQFIMGPTKQMMIDGVKGFRILPEAVAAAELVDGELVITYALNKAFPLIRYKTGDHFEVSESATKKYGEGIPILTWAGKGGVDVVRVHGVEIRTGTVDDFFDTLPQSINAYQLHILPGEMPGTLSLRVEYVMNSPSDVISSLIRDRFLADFKLSQSSSVADAVDLGLVDSVFVQSVTEVSFVSQKRRVLITHIV